MRQRGGLPVEVDGGLGALGVGALPARSEASRHADASGGEPGVVREGDGGGLRAGRRVPHAREVEPPGGASLESWARLDDLTVRATRALNIGVYGPSEGVRPTSPLLSRLLESNSPVVEHTYLRIKRFRINLLIFVRELPCLLNPDHPAARPGPCPRRRRPVHRDVSLLHAANEPGVRGGGTTATTPEAEGEPGHHQLLQSLLEGTYIPDLPPSITSSRINVRLAGSHTRDFSF